MLHMSEPHGLWIAAELPYSVLQYLEHRLAELKPNNGHGLPISSNVTQLGQMSDNKHSYTLAVQAVSSAMQCSFTTSCVRSHLGLTYEAKLFYPSERPPLKIAVRGNYNEHPPRRGFDSQFATIDAPRVPREIARHIFENYVRKLLPRYPCFTDSELWYNFSQVYDSQTGSGANMPDISRFVVSIVLAISCLTSKGQDFSRVVSLCESLQRDAMRVRAFLGETSMKSLQCFLLIMQLGLLLPYTSNLWYTSGEAVRIAIGLGLHQELNGLVDSDPREVNLRRLIFWTVRLSYICFPPPLRFHH